MNKLLVHCRDDWIRRLQNHRQTPQQRQTFADSASTQKVRIDLLVPTSVSWSFRCSIMIRTFQWIPTELLPGPWICVHQWLRWERAAAAGLAPPDRRSVGLRLANIFPCADATIVEKMKMLSELGALRSRTVSSACSVTQTTGNRRFESNRAVWPFFSDGSFRCLWAEQGDAVWRQALTCSGQSLAFIPTESCCVKNTTEKKLDGWMDDRTWRSLKRVDCWIIDHLVSKYTTSHCSCISGRICFKQTTSLRWVNIWLK